MDNFRKRSAVIICDAWKTCFPNDVESFPQLPTETKAFGTYLNHVCSLLREDYDIWHIAEGREIMDEIDTYTDKVADTVAELPKDYPMYYFCGFHLGRCTNGKAIDLHKIGIDLNRLGIVFNLSILFPCDDYNMARYREYYIKQYNYQHAIRGFTTDYPSPPPSGWTYSS